MPTWPGRHSICLPPSPAWSSPASWCCQTPQLCFITVEIQKGLCHFISQFPPASIASSTEGRGAGLAEGVFGGCCWCVCVCARERETDRQTDRQWQSELCFFQFWIPWDTFLPIGLVLPTKTLSSPVLAQSRSATNVCCYTEGRSGACAQGASEWEEDLERVRGLPGQWVVEDMRRMCSFGGN